MWRWLARRLVPDEALRLGPLGPWSFLYADLSGHVLHGGFMPECWLFVDGKAVTGAGEWLQPGQQVQVRVMYPEPGHRDLFVELRAGR